MLRSFPFQLGLLFALLVACAPATPASPAQSPASFEEWMAGGEREDIPWKASAKHRGLSYYQRLVARMEVRVDGDKLKRLGDRHDLVLEVRLADESGGWLEPRAIRSVQVTQPLGKRTYLLFVVEAFVQPGDYTAGFVLRDQLRDRASVTRERLRVKPLGNDPLPAAWEGLPRVEFLNSGDEIEAQYLPEAQHLNLPVETRRPVEIELLVNFTPSEQYSGSVNIYQRNRATLLAALRVLSDLHPRQGTLRVTALDLLRQRVLFDQRGVDRLDWPGLRAALEEINPRVVDAAALAGRRESAAFFRQMLAERIEAQPGAGYLRSPAGERPLRVFVVLSSAVLFERGADLRPLEADEATCSCRVYHLEFRIARSNLWDELRRIFHRLEPQRFTINSPNDFRKALGRMLAELRTL